jgi:sterol desaturase/sphingolipid hydroxylase (fatty acid hydroxylase superfamily)
MKRPYSTRFDLSVTDKLHILFNLKAKTFMSAFESESMTNPKLFVRYAYVPFMLICVNGLGITLLLSPATSMEKVIYTVSLIFAALTLSFSVERILPYRQEWNRNQGDRKRDIAHTVVNLFLSFGPTLIIPLVVVAVPQQISTGVWPSDWNLVIQILFALAIFDLVQNLFHWLSHVWTPLWRLHEVHHEVQRMYGLNGIMKHPIYQILSGLAAMLPLTLMGMPKEFALVISFCSFVQLLIQHSNVDYRTGVLRYIVSTAEVHRFHHLVGQAGNVNFALFFSFWDHLFGNAHYESRRVNTIDIGLEDKSYPVSWAGQMVAPFRRSENYNKLTEN